MFLGFPSVIRIAIEVDKNYPLMPPVSRKKVFILPEPVRQRHEALREPRAARRRGHYPSPPRQPRWP